MRGHDLGSGALVTVEVPTYPGCAWGLGERSQGPQMERLMTQLPGTKWLSLDPELNKITVQADR